MRLPNLPRRIVLWASLAVLAGMVLTTPYTVSDRNIITMREIVDTAARLSKIDGLQSMPGEFAMTETTALPMAGFEVPGAGGDDPRWVWLVQSPPPGPVVMQFDVGDNSYVNKLHIVRYIFLCPADELFAIRDSSRDTDADLAVIASFGIFKVINYDVTARILISATIMALMMMVAISFAVRYFMQRSLDDLFVKIYGSTGMLAAGDLPAFDTNSSTQDLLRSLDRFQDRMRAHVDEQARLAALGAGTSFLAHDLRNLLASFQLNADQLQQMPGEREQRLGQRLQLGVEQALSLVEWATLYTSEKRENLDVQKTALQPIVDDALNFVRLHDPRQKVELRNSCEATAEVVAEPTLMFRIIYNLALNAMQAMKPQSGVKRLTVNAFSDVRQCVITVEDTGPGLPAEGRGNLLMPHVGSGRPDGTGLGLKIVTDLVSWHGGKIEVGRADSQGTHFKITIPHDAKNAPRDQVLEATPSLDAPAMGS